ncbi:serine/threonine-protein kinase [Microbacterium sp. NPDC089318]
MTTDDSLPASGLLDGRYQLLECVGQGGMARVYRAEDTLLGRIVAIKLLRSELEGDESSTGRARAETAALASLNHPALVTLYDAQLVPGRPEYLVMEFVDGPTLADRIPQGALAPADVAALTADLAEALHVVHSAGIVHRDIKPSNVLLSSASFPASRSGAKLADFGISALVDAARLTSPGIVIGTAAYIAPEQLQGAMPAPAADIYALGLLALESLTGTRAFPQREGIGAAMARLTTAPEIPADLGPAWSSLLTAMTAIDPGDRPTASEVFSAASDLTIASAPPLRPTTPAAVAAAAAAAAAGAAGAAAAGTGSAASAAAAETAPADAVTAAMSTSAVGVPSASAGETSTRVLPAVTEGSDTAPTAKRRRLGAIWATAAAVAAASIVAGAWVSGNAAPDPTGTNPADTGGTAPATPTAPASTPDADESGSTKGGDDSKDDRKAQEDAEKAAKKAEEEQRKAAEKAEEERQKAEEETQKEAEDAAEDAEPDAEPEPTPESEPSETPQDEAEATPQPSPAPTG